jgi:hypothetical protein
MEVVENGRKCLYQNYNLGKPEYSLDIDLFWLKGNARAKAESREILAYVVYSIRAGE